MTDHQIEHTTVPLAVRRDGQLRKETAMCA